MYTITLNRKVNYFFSWGKYKKTIFDIFISAKSFSGFQKESLMLECMLQIYEIYGWMDGWMYKWMNDQPTDWPTDWLNDW